MELKKQTKNTTKENTKFKLDKVAIRMVKEPPILSNEKIKSVEQARNLVARILKEYDREVFGVVTLNAKLMPINFTITSIGTLSFAVVGIADIFKTAILSNANAILVFHNHPSGDTEPSNEDIMLTTKLEEAGDILGIKVIDHLIVGNEILSIKQHMSNIRLGLFREK